MLGEILVLTLDRTPWRWEAFEAANSGLVPYQRISAVDGKQLNHDELVGRGLVDLDLAYSAGAIGCALSHASLWRRCVETQAPITVCEDDVLLRSDFMEASQASLAGQADADFVLWGWNFDSILAGRLFGEAPFAMRFDQDAMRQSVVAFKEDRRRPALLRLHRALGIPCYTVTPNGARSLLEACFPLAPGRVHFPLLEQTLVNTGVDMPMNAIYPYMQAYVPMPPLALTLNRLDLSTIQAG